MENCPPPPRPSVVENFRRVFVPILRMRTRCDPAAMPCVIPEIVQFHEFNMRVGERHVDPAGQHLAAGIMVSPRRSGRRTVAVPVNQTKAHAMSAPRSLAGVAVVKIYWIERGICFQREHVIPG